MNRKIAGIEMELWAWQQPASLPGLVRLSHREVNL